MTVASSKDDSTPRLVLLPDFLLATLLHISANFPPTEASIAVSEVEDSAALFGWFSQEVQTLTIKAVMPLLDPAKDLQAIQNAAAPSTFETRYVDFWGSFRRIPGKRRKSRKLLLPLLSEESSNFGCSARIVLVMFEEGADLVAVHCTQSSTSIDFIPVRLIGSMEWSLSRFAREAYFWESSIYVPTTSAIDFDDEASLIDNNSFSKSIKRDLQEYETECQEYEALFLDYQWQCRQAALHATSK